MAITDVDARTWLSTAELGEELVGWAVRSAAAECRWLRMLAEFDVREGWYADGQLSAVDWLVWRCGMSARTARDKVRVAHELGRRPAVETAFAAGRLSYCKVRAITRVTDVDGDVDEWLIRLAEQGTVADLDRAVRHWADLRDQERGVDDYLRRFDRRAVHASRTYDGMVVLEVVLPQEEGEEALALLDGAVDGGSREPQRRADALMVLLRGEVSAATRYTLNLVAEVDAVADRFGLRAEMVDGSPVSTETLRRLSCDCGVVRHLFRGRSQPLDVGARTPVWTTAQRRAITLRDHGRCRFVACERRTCDIHLPGRRIAPGHHLAPQQAEEDPGGGHQPEHAHEQGLGLPPRPRQRPPEDHGRGQVEAADEGGGRGRVERPREVAVGGPRPGQQRHPARPRRHHHDGEEEVTGGAHPRTGSSGGGTRPGRSGPDRRRWWCRSTR